MTEEKVKDKNDESLINDVAFEVQAEPAEGNTEAKNRENALSESDLTTEIEALQTKLQQLEDQLKEKEDKTLRVQAEMENLRRRTQKDMESAHKFALEKFLHRVQKHF